MLWVRNGNSKDFVTRFAGVELTFPSAKWTQIDPGAATVIFGLGGGRDLQVINANFGVLPSKQYAEALAWLNNFTFSEGDNPPKGA
jgi:hypothetical protein